jgi:hypothetical protein
MLKFHKITSNLRVIFCLIISFCTASCGNKESSSEQESSTKQETVQASKPKHDLKLNKHDLQGIWGTDTLENAIFAIRDDSLIFTEHLDTPYFFELKGDSIDIDVDGFKLIWIVQRLNSDSLVVASQTGVVSTYIRF